MADGATEFLNFMIAFITKYPEYNNRPVVIAGESYAGKYIPEFSAKISAYNRYQKSSLNADKVIINVVALLVGDPFVTGLLHTTQTYKLPLGLGLIDQS